MATRTSVASGLFSAASTWNTGVPVNGDAFIVAANHTVVYDIVDSYQLSGTLSPDATGLYTYKGVTANGFPYYQRGSDSFYFFVYQDPTLKTFGWYCTTVLNNVAGDRWRVTGLTNIISPVGQTYGAAGSATGTLTVADGIAFATSSITGNLVMGEQLTVSGTLTPDVTGTYHYTKSTNGLKVYKSDVVKDDGAGGTCYYYVVYTNPNYFLISRWDDGSWGTYYWARQSSLGRAGAYGPGSSCTGTATVALDSSMHVLKLSGSNLTGTGTLTIGLAAEPLPANCFSKIQYTAAGGCYISLTTFNAVNIYCTQPTRVYTRITQLANAGATALVCANDVSADAPWLVAGATVAIVDSVATMPDIEERTIASISGTTINLTAGLTASKSVDSAVVLIYRNVQIVGVSASGWGLSGVIGGNQQLLIRDCGRAFNGCAQTAFNGVAYYNGSGYGCYYHSGGSFQGAIVGFTAVGLYAAMMGSYINCLMAGNASYTINMAMGCNFGPQFKILGANSGINSAAGCVFNGCEFTHGTQAAFALNRCRFFNCLMTQTYEIYSYSRDDWNADTYNESFNHDQVAGAFRCWSKGGYTDWQTAIKPTGKSGSFVHTCISATVPCFRQIECNVEPGETLRVDWWMAKGSSMAILPKVEIIDMFADPLISSSNSPLATVSMTNSIDTWENGSLSWTNSGTACRPVLARISGQVASGYTFYEYTEIKKFKTAEIPAITDTRTGIVFGPGLDRTGTCAVPSAANTRYGIPVDATTGLYDPPFESSGFISSSVAGFQASGQGIGGVRTFQSILEAASSPHACAARGVVNGVRESRGDLVASVPAMRACGLAVIQHDDETQLFEVVSIKNIPGSVYKQIKLTAQRRPLDR